MRRYRLDPNNPPRLTDEEARRLDEAEIDYSDIPELGDEFFTKASIVTDGNEINWSQCPDAERIPGKMSDAWCLKGTRIRCEDITGQFDGGCSAEKIAGPDIYDLDVELVKRILAFAGRSGPPPLMSGEGEPTALLLQIILNECSGDGIMRRLSERADPDALCSYGQPDYADAMIALHGSGYIEITRQDGAQMGKGVARRQEID